MESHIYEISKVRDNQHGQARIARQSRLDKTTMENKGIDNKDKARTKTKRKPKAKKGKAFSTKRYISRSLTFLRLRLRHVCIDVKPLILFQ